MKIGFGDGGLAKLLNDYAALETRFGATLAESVAIRLGVLAAARHVGCLPRRAPIGLECDDEAQGIFSIDLGSTRTDPWVTFHASSGHANLNFGAVAHAYLEADASFGALAQCSPYL